MYLDRRQKYENGENYIRKNFINCTVSIIRVIKSRIVR
jgi:hypothetical protein